MELSKGQLPGGIHLQKATELYRRNKDLSSMGMQREEEWVVVAVTKEYAESLTAAKRSDLLACLGIHDKNSWAHHADRSTHAHVLRSLSVLSAPWLCLVRMRRSLKSTGSIWFCGRRGHMYNWREDSRILSLRHDGEPNDVALYGVYPIPEPAQTGAPGEVELQHHATHIGDNSIPFEEEQGSSIVTTHGLFEGIEKFL